MPAGSGTASFPPGYPFLLTVLPGPRLIESAFLFNVGAGITLLVVVWTWVQRRAGPWPAHLAAALVAVHPLVLTQVLTTGPDAAFVTLSVLGALLLFSAVDGAPAMVGTAVVAGIALAAAGWLRYHAFPFSAALLAAIGLAAGDLLSVQRDQAFNVFTRLVEAPNWFHLPPPAELPQTVGEAIARNPGAFRRFGVFTLLTGLLFVPVVNLGASPRGIAGMVPLALITIAWTAMAGVARVRAVAARRAIAAGLAVIGLGHGWQVWRPEILGYVDAARIRSQGSAALEAALRADGVVIGSQVFATAEVYFLGASGWQVGNYHPRIVGGWPTIDLAGYFEAYPQPSTASLDALLDDCQRVGVTHLVLGGASFLVQPELGELYDGRRSSPRVAEISGTPGVRVFRLVG